MSTREQWLQAFTSAAREVFAAKGYPLPPNVRMSVGFTSGGRRSKAIGECWSSLASRDDHFEVFIHPSLDQSDRVADVLTHELCHAAVGLAAKHGPVFGKAARAMGLEGKLTATVAGPAFYAWARPILDALGPIPHGKLTAGGSSAKPKQATRMIKCECDTCGFVRAARTHIEAALDSGESPRCPNPTCEGVMLVGADVARVQVTAAMVAAARAVFERNGWPVGETTVTMALREALAAESEVRRLRKRKDREAAPRPPHVVLNVVPHAGELVIRAAWRAKVAKLHPDAGGTDEEVAEVNAARDAMLKALRR